MQETQATVVAPPKFDESAIRQHVDMLHRLAEGQDGLLVTTTFYANPTGDKDVQGAVTHHRIGDVDGMVEAIMAHDATPNANAYCIPAVMRRNLPRGKKGSEADVVAVLALVADYDNDADRAGVMPVKANYVIESSPGNFQHFVLLDRPLPQAEAKLLAVAFKRASGSDHCTADISHTWRVPGALNWPNRKKLERGRSPDPLPVTVAEHWDGSMTSVDSLREAVASYSTTPGEQVAVSLGDLPSAGDIAVSPRTAELLAADDVGDRSAHAARVVEQLAFDGHSAEEAAALFLAAGGNWINRYKTEAKARTDFERLWGKPAAQEHVTMREAGARLSSGIVWGKKLEAANDNSANAPEYYGELADHHYYRLSIYRKTLGEGVPDITWNGSRWQIEGVVIGDAAHVIYVDKGEIVTDGGQKVEAPPPERMSIFDWPASRFTGNPPEVKYLVRGVVPLGVPAMVAAMGDTGKSFALMEIHRRVSFGRRSHFPDPILGDEVVVEGTSVMITSEDDCGEAHRRLAALDPDGTRSRLGDKMLVVPLPSAGGATAYWRDDKRLGLVETDHYKRLCDELLSISDLKVVTLDPLASFAHLPINEDPAAGQFVCTSLSKLATATGATIFVAHHMRKSQKPIETLAEARDAIRGSSALVDGLRLAYALWPAEEPRARKICRGLGVDYQDKKVVLGGVVKANGAAKRTISTYIRNDFGLLVDKTAWIGAQAPDQGDINASLLLAVESAARSGQPFTKTGAAGLFALKERLPGELRALSKHKLESATTKLVEEGKLVLCLAGGTVAKWLDVPTGPFAMGLGEFRKGMLR